MNSAQFQDAWEDLKLMQQPVVYSYNHSVSPKKKRVHYNRIMEFEAKLMDLKKEYDK